MPSRAYIYSKRVYLQANKTEEVGWVTTFIYPCLRFSDLTEMTLIPLFLWLPSPDLSGPSVEPTTHRRSN
jgi:hypothetical protein